VAADILLGILVGAAWGCLTNAILFRKMENNRAAGIEPLRGIGLVFFVRYLLDAAALVILYLVTRSAPALVAAAVSITVAVKVSLFTVFLRKGGKLE
jgi:hypothetical protein